MQTVSLSLVVVHIRTNVGERGYSGPRATVNINVGSIAYNIVGNGTYVLLVNTTRRVGNINNRPFLALLLIFMLVKQNARTRKGYIRTQTARAGLPMPLLNLLGAPERNATIKHALSSPPWTPSSPAAKDEIKGYEKSLNQHSHAMPY